MVNFKYASLLSISMEGDEAFFKVYSSVPIEERQKVVVVLDGKPISWDLAYQEIKNKTDRGGKVLNILKELGII